MRSNDPASKKLIASIAGTAPGHELVGAVYGDPATHAAKALVFGGTDSVSDARIPLASYFAGFEDGSGLRVTGTRTYPTGLVGDMLQCGEAPLHGASTICAWSDRHADVVAIVLGTKQDDGAALVVTILPDLVRQS